LNFWFCLYFMRAHSASSAVRRRYQVQPNSPAGYGLRTLRLERNAVGLRNAVASLLHRRIPRSSPNSSPENGCCRSADPAAGMSFAGRRLPAREACASRLSRCPQSDRPGCRAPRRVVRHCQTPGFEVPYAFPTAPHLQLDEQFRPSQPRATELQSSRRQAEVLLLQAETHSGCLSLHLRWARLAAERS
jgi:hypothetical protein